MKKLLFALLGLLILASPAAAQQSTSAVATTITNSTITVTDTFQSVLAQSSLRKGCRIQNTAASIIYVYLGPITSASKAASFQLAAGATFDCSTLSGAVAGDQISLTGTAAATYVVARQ